MMQVDITANRELVERITIRNIGVLADAAPAEHADMPRSVCIYEWRSSRTSYVGSIIHDQEDGHRELVVGVLMDANTHAPPPESG